MLLWSFGEILSLTIEYRLYSIQPCHIPHNLMHRVHWRLIIAPNISTVGLVVRSTRSCLVNLNYTPYPFHFHGNIGHNRLHVGVGIDWSCSLISLHLSEQSRDRHQQILITQHLHQHQIKISSPSSQSQYFILTEIKGTFSISHSWEERVHSVYKQL